MLLTQTSFFSFLLGLRLRQIYRACAEVGFLLLFPLAMFALMALRMMELLSKTQHLAWALIVPLLALSVHFKRKDANFLTQLCLRKKVVYAFEYALLALPMAIIVAFFQPFTTVLLGVFGSVMVAFLPQKEKKSSVSSLLSYNFIPLSLFEWRFGFRRENLGVIFIILYVLALIGSAWEGAILVFALFSSFCLISIYDFCEPKEWLTASFSLWKKLKLHLLAWSLLLLPHAFACWFWHPTLWYFPLIAWYFGAMLIAFCLAYKYKVWSPFRHQVNNAMAAYIFIGMMLTIFISPACIFAIAYYWRKSLRNV